MRRALLLLLVFVVLLVAPAAVRYLNFYELSAVDRGQIPTYDPVDLVRPEPTPPAASFVDEPEMGDGRVLFDRAHDNAFTLDELGYLSGRLAARGYDLVAYEGGDLAAALRAVNAFVVITPLSLFTLDEVQAVRNFVERGGRLLLVGDPTRFNVVIEEDFFAINVLIEDDEIPLNSLAAEFDMTFKGDYLYNMRENEGNFRNIMLHGASFGEGALTADLETVVFYGAHSIDMGPGAQPLLSGDDNTWSSDTDRPGGLTLAATSRGGQVVALSDIQFMTEPYYTAYDNGRFIAHLADFLAEPASRTFMLADFPYFYQSPVGLIYSGAPELGPGAFAQVIRLQEAFRSVGQEINLAAADTGQDTLYLGLYNQADETVLEILASQGISFTITPPILTEAEEKALAGEEMAGEEAEEESEEDEAAESEAEAETETSEDSEDENGDDTAEAEAETMVRLIHTPLGNMQMSGTALVLLDESDGRRQVIVLAASREGLDNTVDLLLQAVPIDGIDALANCVLQGNLALCPTGIAAEEIEAELITGGGPDGAEEAEEAEEEAEEEEESEPEAEPVEDLEATEQGPIGLGETVEGTLEIDESHAWIFTDGPAFIDIVVEGEDLDAVLELYDPDNVLISSADATFEGEAEEILGAEIEDDGPYTIVVRDYFDDGAGYTLTVTEAEAPPADEEEDESEGSGAIENIFLFVDDNGEALASGFTSAETFVTLLSDSYEVTTWVSSVDGPLEEGVLDEADLLIWDSGDYRDEEAFFNEDIFIIFDYLDAGGALFITGSSPPLFSDVALAPLSDVEVAGDEPILLAGLDPGEIIELDDTYDTVLSELLAEDADEGTTAFFLRGPGSDASGDVVGLAAIDSFTDQRSVLLLLPLVTLPEEVQVIVVDNVLAWLAEGAGGE